MRINSSPLQGLNIMPNPNPGLRYTAFRSTLGYVNTAFQALWKRCRIGNLTCTQSNTSGCPNYQRSPAIINGGKVI